MQSEAYFLEGLAPMRLDGTTSTRPHHRGVSHFRCDGMPQRMSIGVGCAARTEEMSSEVRPPDDDRVLAAPAGIGEAQAPPYRA